METRLPKYTQLGAPVSLKKAREIGRHAVQDVCEALMFCAKSCPRPLENRVSYAQEEAQQDGLCVSQSTTRQRAEEGLLMLDDVRELRKNGHA